jgi:hypothetical protein
MVAVFRALDAMGVFSIFLKDRMSKMRRAGDVDA